MLYLFRKRQETLASGNKMFASCDGWLDSWNEGSSNQAEIGANLVVKISGIQSRNNNMQIKFMAVPEKKHWENISLEIIYAFTANSHFLPYQFSHSCWLRVWRDFLHYRQIKRAQKMQKKGLKDNGKCCICCVLSFHRTHFMFKLILRHGMCVAS